MQNKGKIYCTERNLKETSKDRDCQRFAEILNGLMEERGINAATLAKETGLTEGNISFYRRGQRSPTLNNLVALAGYFKVDLNYFITGVKQRNASISQQTGLSNEAIEKIRLIKYQNRKTWFMDALNALIENENFEALIEVLRDYLTGSSHLIKYGNYSVDYRVLMSNEAQNIFREILKTIDKDFAEKHAVDDRVYYNILYSKYEAGEISKELLRKAIKEFENGNYDYNPLKDNQ